MKPLLLLTACIILFTVSYAQTPKSNWKELTYGTWKLDSAISAEKKITRQKKEDIQAVLWLGRNNAAVLFGDSVAVFKDSFELAESAQNRYIIYKVITARILKINPDKMVLTISSPIFSMRLRPSLLLYFTRHDGVPAIPSISGKWARDEYDYDYYGTETVKEKQFINLKKNGQAVISLKDFKDSGAWKLNPASLVIDFQLSKGLCHSNITGLEKGRSLTLTHPLYIDTVLNFTAEGSDYSYNKNRIDSFAKRDSMAKAAWYDSLSRAAYADSVKYATRIFKTWGLYQVIDGNDTLNTVKFATISFSKDSTCTVTSNGIKESGRFEGNEVDGYLILNVDGKEVMCQYDFDLGDDKKDLMFVKMVLPGKKTIGEYIFN